MATPPLPAAITDRIKARNQSVRWTAILREVREFRSYFCAIDTDGIVGVAFAPVPVLELSPNPVCLDPGNAMDWELGNSYAPGAGVSIASYAIDFGDGNDDTGSNGSHVYGAAGTYTVTATVTNDATPALSQTATEEVNVIDCSDTLLLNSIYASTDGSGVYYWE